jgi:hypothetical protein
LSFAVKGGYATDSFIAMPNLTETDVTLCFVAGTRIATPRGEVPVEQLAPGDEVLTLGGATQPITWIGVGRVLATRGRRTAATPVIVRRGALADNVPCRDLHITKGHSLFIDGVLIPAEFLVNYRSIVWDDAAREVDIYHIELARHDVLIADGAPAESYRDDGNRWLFHNANAGWEDRPPQPPCAPVLTGGALVDEIWGRLLKRVPAPRRRALTDEPDLHLLVDGRRLDAVTKASGASVFALQMPPRSLCLRSRAAAPAELGVARDPRRLGVALRRIVIRQGTRFRVMEADDPSFVCGFHAFEPDEGFRWTNGDATVPMELFTQFAGPLELVLYVAQSARYPLPTPESQGRVSTMR